MCLHQAQLILNRLAFQALNLHASAQAYAPPSTSGSHTGTTRMCQSGRADMGVTEANPRQQATNYRDDKRPTVLRDPVLLDTER